MWYIKEKNLMADIRDKCESGILTAKTCFASTYRNTFSLNNAGEKQWDITHLQYPLPDADEEEARAVLHTPEDADFEKFFNDLVRDHLSYARYFQSVTETGVKVITPTYEGRKMERTEDGGFDIYLVSEPSEPLVGSDLLTTKGTSLFSALKICRELISAAELYEKYKYTIGEIVPDTLCVTEMQHIRFGVLSDVRYTENVKEGLEFTTRNIAKFLWTILCGNNYNVPANLSDQTIYGNKDTALVLSKIISDEHPSFELLKERIVMEYEAIQNGVVNDEQIEFAEPAIEHTPTVVEVKHRKRKQKAEKEAKEEKPKEKPRKNKGKKTKASRVGKSIPLLLCAFLLLFYGFNQYFDFGFIQGKEKEPEVTYDENAITSAVAGLYVSQGRVVNYYGVPSGIYYLDEDGNIMFDPSVVPTSLEKVEYTDEVKNLRDVEGLYFDPTSNGIFQIDASVYDEKGLDLGSVLLMNELHVETAPVSDSDAAAEGSAVESVQTVQQSEHYPKIVAADKSEEGVVTVIVDEAQIYEIYKHMDEELYADLKTLAREDECTELMSRTITDNGREVVIYYDKNGVVHDEEDWIAQQQLAAEIEEIKQRFAGYSGTTEPQTIVKAEYVEEYIYLKNITFGKASYTVTLDKTSYGAITPTLFVVEVSVSPANATCQEVQFIITPDEGLIVPYLYNSPYMTREYKTSDQITNTVLDFSKGENGKLTLVFQGQALGEYEIITGAEAGTAQRNVKITLTDEVGYTEDIPDDVDIPDPDPIPQQQTNNSTGSGSSGGYHSGGSSSGGSSGGTSSGNANSGTAGESQTSSDKQQEGTSGSEQKEDEPIVSGKTEQESGKESSGTSGDSGSTGGSSGGSSSGSTDSGNSEPVYELKEFYVNPSSVTLHVGETCMLSPNYSCVWGSSKTSVAYVGQPQGRCLIARSVGSCVITARCSDGSGRLAYVYVTVIE